MATGLKKLKKTQIGLETTAGTAVAATVILRHLGNIEDAREDVFPEEDVALIPGTDRNYTSHYLGKYTQEEAEATFEQLPYVLACGVENVTSGSTDTGGSGKIYQFDFATSSANTPKTATIEAGDNNAVEEVEYAFVENFSLSGSPKQAVMLSADWVGRQVSTSAFTSALSLEDVEEIMFQKAKLYISDPADGFGNNLVSDTLYGFSMDVPTGIKPEWTGSGELYFTTISQGGELAPMLDITFEHNASATTERAKWKSKDTRLVRLLIEGSTLTTAGETYSKKTLIIDLAGRWEKFEPLGDEDGTNTVVAKLRGRYNATAAAMGKFIVVNEKASL